MPLGIEGIVADIRDGPYRTERLFLFERGTKTPDTGVAVHVEGTGAVGCGVSVGEDQNWWGTELGEDLACDNLYGRRKVVLNPHPEKGGEMAYPLGQIG